ncbi:conserved hypothetical protein [metagenome]|uniref:Transmembrane protein n=1 Tax=metagenome TaxID=256318 RepID=A0A2P2C6K4_9ZZZZ
MKIYADRAGRRTAQIVADLLVVAFVALSIWVALQVHDLVDSLASPSRTATSSAGDLASSLRDAGEAVGGIPLVPDGVSAPFDQSASAADDIAAASTATTEVIEDLSRWLAISTAVLPILLALAAYLPGRLRWIRRATAGQRFIDSADDLDLFALRALTRQPLHVLAKLSDDPAGGWRRKDPDLIVSLSLLELRDCGLDPGPATVRS